MNLHYDPETDAMYLRFSDRPTVESEEVERGIVFDFDGDGNVVAIEILSISRYTGKRRPELNVRGISHVSTAKP